MAFTLICHICGHKLKLFDSSIKKRKGTIRCPHCSVRIPYDLDNRKIQKSGFWAAEEPAFDYRAKNRMLNQLERDKNHKNPDGGNVSVSQEQAPLGANPFRSRTGFAGFDLKTGQILEKTVKSSLPVHQTRHSAPQRIRDSLYRKKTVHSTFRKLMRQESFLSFSWTSVLFQKIKNLFHR